MTESTKPNAELKSAIARHLLHISQARLAREHAHWSNVLIARADALDEALRAEGLSGACWDGGFFVTIESPTPMELSDRLTNEGVFVVPIPEGVRVGVCGLRVADAPRFAAAIRSASA